MSTLLYSIIADAFERPNGLIDNFSAHITLKILSVLKLILKDLMIESYVLQHCMPFIARILGSPPEPLHILWINPQT